MVNSFVFFLCKREVIPLNVKQVLKDKPVIAAIRNPGEFLSGRAYTGDAGVLFLIGGTIFDLPAFSGHAKRYNKQVFVDIDLIKGLGKDASGIRYLAKEAHIHGIITTKSNLIRSSQKEGLISVQRIFVLDSESLAGGLNVISKSRPDAVEILPGLILPKIIDRIRAVSSLPIIAGGLITKQEEIQEILSSGAVGISTSAPGLFASR